MTSNKTKCERKLMKSEKYTGSFLLIEIMQVALRALFSNQNLYSKAFLLPKPLVDILQIFLIFSKVQRNAILFPTNLSRPNK